MKKSLTGKRGMSFCVLLSCLSVFLLSNFSSPAVSAQQEAVHVFSDDEQATLEERLRNLGYIS